MANASEVQFCRLKEILIIFPALYGLIVDWFACLNGACCSDDPFRFFGIEIVLLPLKSEPGNEWFDGCFRIICEFIIVKRENLIAV